MTSKNKLFGNKCPYCDKIVTFEKEDDRCDTDLGVYGNIAYFCPECNKDVTEDFDFD